MKVKLLHVTLVAPDRPAYCVFAWMDCYRNLVSMFAVGVN